MLIQKLFFYVSDYESLVPVSGTDGAAAGPDAVSHSLLSSFCVTSEGLCFSTLR